MRKFFAVATVAALTSLTAVAAVQAAEPADYVAYRKAELSAAGGHMKSIVTFLKTGIDVPNQVESHATAIAAILETLPAAFPEGTDAVAETEAKPDVWSNMDGFKAAAEKAQKAALELASAAAAGGGMAEIGPKVQALGGACKGCHDDFRTKKD